MKRGIIRQGDVLMIPVGKAPIGIEPETLDPRGIVLAEGETSGHHHGVVGSGCKLFRFREQRSERLLTVGRGGAEVRVIGGGSGGVDRHTPVSLKPGHYLVRIQRSWSTAHASRQVQD